MIQPLPEQLGYQSCYFDLSGLRMHAVMAGPENGPLVILLHGFPEFWYSWRFQIGPLAQAGFRVIAPDQRGYNLTDKHGPFDIRTLTDDMIHLIQGNGHERAFIIGHDWGAAVAWRLVEKHPDRVQRLAILNLPHPRLMQRAILGGKLKQMLKSWYIFYFQLPWLPERLMAINGYGPLRDAVRLSANPGTFSDIDLARFVEAWSQPGAMTAMLGWYRAYVRGTAAALARRRGATSSSARRISVPTLMIFGEKDIALEVSLAEASLALLEQGRLVRFPDATHWVQQDKPAEVTRELLAFLTTA